MNELNMLYEKYNSGEYDIADVSRILSYISISDEVDEVVQNVEYQIENIRFLTSESEQKEKVNAILVELIEECKNGEDR